MIHEYRLRHVVEAVRWNEDPNDNNVGEILAFAAGHVQTVTDFAVFFSHDVNARILTRGSWAVKNPHTGMVTAMPDKSFHETYVEV